ncbi:hypothetical protein [uncultured Sphaerotilus sp.]|uniref:hypothetical protein n=1 Tax=uncultured Sphaerotilus sp. TaxID=474984 RepID=UPI0030CA52AA
MGCGRIPPWRTTVGQVLGEALVVDAQRATAIPALGLLLRSAVVMATLRGGIAFPALLLPGWRGVPARRTAVGQILRKSLVVDAQRAAAIPALGLLRSAVGVIALLCLFPFPRLLLLDALRLGFSERRTWACTRPAQGAASGRLPLIVGRGGFFFQSECDHVVMRAQTQGFRNGTPLRLCYLLLQY